MTLYVFKCQECAFLIKHSLDKPIGDVYIYNCPKCKKSNKFKFLRENDPVKDWYANILKIRNKRRRQGDALYKEKTDEAAS
jgi:hypothetical protein